MIKTDWRMAELDQGVLREPTPDENRIIMWIPGNVDGGFRHWERLTNVSGAEVVEEQGICFTQATALPAKQKVQGFFGRVLDRLRKPPEHSWLLPTGGVAEQAGERRTGLLLAWAPEEAGTLDESVLRARLTGGQGIRRIGRNLFVVSPAQAGPTSTEGTPALLGNPLEQADQLLGAARQAGDRRAEAAALTDLGIALTRSGDSQRALVTLEEAVAINRQSADRSGENDALGNLGMTLLAAGHAGRAQEVLGQALAHARETGDRFEEKLILANLGAVLATMRDFGEALVASDHALSLARELGDRVHEAELLWFQAIQHAELGHMDTAGNLAQAAIDVHATLRSPHVAWLTGHLKKFRPLSAQVRTATASARPGGYYTGPTVQTAPAPEIPVAACDPGILRTAMSALKAMENSAGSGVKTVTPELHQQRLEICAVCPHHTGMRCKLCGDFTKAKAWLPYANCPIGKWK